jgi:hypothetical protein
MACADPQQVVIEHLLAPAGKQIKAGVPRSGRPAGPVPSVHSGKPRPDLTASNFASSGGLRTGACSRSPSMTCRAIGGLTSSPSSTMATAGLLTASPAAQTDRRGPTADHRGLRRCRRINRSTSTANGARIASTSARSSIPAWAQSAASGRHSPTGRRSPMTGRAAWCCSSAAQAVGPPTLTSSTITRICSQVARCERRNQISAPVARGTLLT